MTTLCTLQEIKDWLKVTDNSQDAILTSTQAAVERAVINFCDNDFTEKTVTAELVDGTGSDVVVVAGYPINSVTGLYFNPEASGAGGEEVGAENYVVKQEAIYLVNGLYTPRGRATVKVAYKHGYTSVPDDVKMAVKMGVEAFMARRARKSVGVASRGKEGENESFVNAWDKYSGLPLEVTGLLGSYKGMEFPAFPTAQRNL